MNVAETNKLKKKKERLLFNVTFMIFSCHSIPVNQPRSDTVDLTDTSLMVDISDALSEREKVKFTVHTKVS